MSGLSDNNTCENDLGGSAGNIHLLLAVNEAASLLLTTDDEGDIDDVLVSSLEIIGNAIDADRVHIWRDTHSDDEMVLERLCTWLGDNVDNLPELSFKTISLTEKHPSWIEIFHNGKWVGGVLSSLTPSEQAFFCNLEIKAVYIVPLLLNNTFWGVVGIDYFREERSLTDEEIVILKSVSLMVASAINHHRMVVELITTNSKADAASKAKNAFLSNMSHEVRTPLNAIVGMTVVGREADSIAEKDRALRQIGDASAHLLEIISNVLDMARIEEGKLELVPVEYAFRELIDKVLITVKPLAKEKNQTLDIRIDDAIPRYVVGDDLRLNQLITNLMSNAVKFTPIYGKIQLDVALSVETDEHLELNIFVKDNGIGISDDQRSKLFIAFEQAQGALNREYGGTGLGLPISKRIVELMDGSIWVESEPNRGTTVYLTIQLAKSHKKDDTDEMAAEADSKQSGGGESNGLIVPGEFKGKRLLIVEDIEINREILIALLKPSELIIECAEDGQVALNMVMFNVDKYDIVFMDLQMPNMGGLEATRSIRELPERERGRLPIIAMTANVLSEDIKACIDAGMDDHLSKPLDLPKVLEMLRKHLA